MYKDFQQDIKEIVDRETEAWNNKETQRLLSIFHPDMVWLWPKTSDSHDPVDWIFELGRFDIKDGKKSMKSFCISYSGP